MIKILRHITLLIISGLFMISSSGVYLTVHYCSNEDITGLFFFTTLTEEPCDHHSNISDQSSFNGNGAENQYGDGSAMCCNYSDHYNGSCNMTAEFPECCSNTFLYIAFEDDFVKSDYLSDKVKCNLLQFVVLPDITVAAVNKDDFSFNKIKAPPNNLYGKDLAFFNCILLL